MASLHEVVALIRKFAEAQGIPLGEEGAMELEMTIRREHPGKRIYIQPIASRKDPERKAAMMKLAETLPSRVVAERFGVTRNYVSMLAKRAALK